MRTLILGKTGQVASELARTAWPDHFEIVQLGRLACDLGSADSIRAAFSTHTPGLVVNAAAYTAVDRAESDVEKAQRINCAGPELLARCCSESGAALIHLSTDYVFDGTKTTPYSESERTNPLSVYGRTKRDGEVAVRANLDRHVVVRSSWVFSAHGTNFVKTMLRLASERRELRVVDDQRGCPTAARDIAEAIKAISIAIDNGFDDWGTFHFAGTGPATWFEFARSILAIDPVARDAEVRPISSAEYPTAARRPANSVLDCSRVRSVFGIEQPHWRLSLAATMSELLASRNVA